MVPGSGMRSGADARGGGAASGPATPTEVPCLVLSMLKASPEPPLRLDVPADMASLCLPSVRLEDGLGIEDG